MRTDDIETVRAAISRLDPVRRERLRYHAERGTPILCGCWEVRGNFSFDGKL